MNTFTASPVFGVSITVMFYAAGMLLQRKLSWAHPLITTCVGLMMTIRLLHIPLENYAIGGDMITYLLGPAVIALGVPMYKNGKKLRKAAVPLSVSIGVGSAVGMITAGVCAGDRGGNGASGGDHWKSCGTGNLALLRSEAPPGTGRGGGNIRTRLWHRSYAKGA